MLVRKHDEIVYISVRGVGRTSVSQLVKSLFRRRIRRKLAKGSTHITIITFKSNLHKINERPDIGHVKGDEGVFHVYEFRLVDATVNMKQLRDVTRLTSDIQATFPFALTKDLVHERSHDTVLYVILKKTYLWIKMKAAIDRICEC